MEKALKDMEISSQGERNGFFLALFKHDLKRDWRQAAFFSPQLGEKRLEKFDDTHPSQSHFMPHLQPRTGCWEKKQVKSGEKTHPVFQETLLEAF